MAVTGCGVGGGSLVYASILVEPPMKFFDAPQMRKLADWRVELSPHFRTARRMLGVTPCPVQNAVDDELEAVVRELGCGARFERTHLGIYFGKPGEEGVEVPDPFFEGRGPPRAGCIRCGGCMVGCRHGAKNTLDKNYLHRAEANGVIVKPETEVIDLRPIPRGGGENDGRGGYEVVCKPSTSRLARTRTILTTRGIILAAGTLGTMELLLRCRDRGGLPRISNKLGDDVRINNEEFLFSTTRNEGGDASQGTAANGYVAVEDTRVVHAHFPPRSDFFRLITMRFGGSRWKRLARLPFQPADAFRLMKNRRWSETTSVLMGMHTRETRMKLCLGRNPLTMFRKVLVTKDDSDPAVRVPARRPEYHEMLERFAARTNGIAQETIHGGLLGISTTAHVFGGCPMSKTADEGVVDSDHRLFGYENFYVCDGSTLNANVGRAPSLTIAAFAERCMSRIPANSS